MEFLLGNIWCLVCVRIAVAFGGSGFKSVSVSVHEDSTPSLLSAPVKMIDKADLATQKHSYGGVILNTAAMRESDNDHAHQPPAVVNNSNLDVSVIPTTQVIMNMNNLLSFLDCFDIE